MQQSLIAVSYDIEENRIRVKVAKLLGGFGERVQKSVYEVLVSDKQLERLRAATARLLGPNDSVRWYRLCENCRKRILISGEGTVTDYPEAIII